MLMRYHEVMRTSLLLSLLLVAACAPRTPSPTAPIAAPSKAEPHDAAPPAGKDAPDAVPPVPKAAATTRERTWAWPAPKTSRPIDLLCDLPDKVITVVADADHDDRTVGSVRSVDRVHGRVTTVKLLPTYDACPGMMKCHYETPRRGMKRLDVEADGRIFSHGNVGDADDKGLACRRHGFSALAICVTRAHSAALYFAKGDAPDAAAPKVALVVYVYGAARGTPDQYGDDLPTQELPAHLVAVPPDGKRWVYRGPGIELSLDVGGSMTGSLRLGDGAPEPCLAAAVDRE
jgi:hypothetical protein